MALRVQPCIAFFFIPLLLCSGAMSATFKMVNNCNYTVWPGILSNAGVQRLPTTGLTLQPGQSDDLSLPFSWAGRLWGRTFCTQDPNTSKFTCSTGDCGTSTLQCSGNGANPPVTLVEFTLNGANGLDFFDVSLVDGYNLPVLVTPKGGKGQGNCMSTGCVVDLNPLCPIELKDNALACKSACSALGDPKYCCSGAYSTPNTCKPSSYSEFFKTNCPKAYSYAYDDQTSTFTCDGADYVITFCPSTSTMPEDKPKTIPVEDKPTTVPKNNFPDGPDLNQGIVFSGSHGIPLQSIGIAIISAGVTMWQLQQPLLFFYFG